MLICSEESEEVLKEQCPPDLTDIQEQDVRQPLDLCCEEFDPLTSVNYAHRLRYGSIPWMLPMNSYKVTWLIQEANNIKLWVEIALFPGLPHLQL